MKAPRSGLLLVHRWRDFNKLQLCHFRLHNYEGVWSFELQVRDSANVPVVVTSNGASVTVNSALAAPTASASLGTVDQGQNSTLSSSAVSTGTSPYSYQWLMKAPGAGSYSSIGGATSTSYSFATSGSTTTGVWSFELQVRDSANVPVVVTSNGASVTVNIAPSVIITPPSWTMDVGQSKQFTAVPAGGSGIYTGYQWYVGGVAQSGQTASIYTYTPSSAGSPSITVTVTDTLGATSTQSSPVAVTVSSVYLLFSADSQTTYSEGQQVSFEVTVLNQQNPMLETSLALTITGPGDYSFYDFQPINVSANGFGEYTFTWSVPDFAGTYVVETNLVPAQLTAYDAKWIEASELSSASVFSSEDSLSVSKSLMSGVFALFVPVESQALACVYCLLLFRFEGKKLLTFSRLWLFRMWLHVLGIAEGGSELSRLWI